MQQLVLCPSFVVVAAFASSALALAPISTSVSDPVCESKACFPDVPIGTDDDGIRMPRVRYG